MRVKWIREQLIIVALAILVSILGTMWYRANQVLRLQDELVKKQLFIQNTRAFLERSKLDAKTVKIFNQLGWNLPVPEPQLPAKPFSK